MTLTFDLLTPNEIGFFLQCMLIYIASLIKIGQSALKLSSRKGIWLTDRYLWKNMQIRYGWPWPFHLKINRGLPELILNIHTEFGSNQSIHTWLVIRKLICDTICKLGRYDLDLWPFDPKMDRVLPTMHLNIRTKFDWSIHSCIIILKQICPKICKLGQNDLDIWPFDQNWIEFFLQCAKIYIASFIENGQSEPKFSSRKEFVDGLTYICGRNAN